MDNASLARDIAARLHHRASYLSRQADITADLRDIASSDMAQMRDGFAMRCRDVLSSYGYCDPPSIEKPFAYAEGIAFIPIHGLLVNRLSWSWSFATGYNFIRSQLNAALADPDVERIVFDVNSPGGIASGCSELALEIFNSRTVKPSLAVVDARCYSAAYFLASAATRIVVTPSGGVGSIGVVSMHVDYSKMLDADGIAITFIVAGDEKVDGNPYEPLSDRARASIQRDVDYHYGLFVEAVARHRDMSEDDVRATQAALFQPPEALDAGLIDAVVSPVDAVANFNELTSDADAGDDDMTEKTTNNATATSAAAPVGMSQEAMQAMIAAEVAKGVAKGLSDSRERSVAIKNCEEAKDKPKLAAALADDTDLSVDAAKVILKAAAVETPESKTDARQAPSAFGNAMDNSPNPNVASDAAAGGGEGGDGAEPGAVANRLLANYNRVSGRPVKLIGGTDTTKAA